MSPIEACRDILHGSLRGKQAAAPTDITRRRGVELWEGPGSAGHKE